MNGDGKADIVCRATDGGIVVYEAKDVGTFYNPGDVWRDKAFRFCPNNPKWVNFVIEYLNSDTENAQRGI